MEIKKLISEFLGTFLLVLIGTGAVVSGELSPLTIGLAFGLTVMMMAFAVGGISGGHFNPAVTLAMVLNKRIDIPLAIKYVGAQFLGALGGSTLVALLVKSASLDKGSLGQNDLTNISPMLGLAIEMVITFIFVFVILMVTSKQSSAASMAPIVIGLTLAILVVVALGWTGGSLNPVRSFGPALYVGGTALSNYWVFLVGPLLGATGASFAAKYLGSEEK